MARFSIAESLEVGWDIAKNNFVLLLGGLVLTLVASFFPLGVMLVIGNIVGAETVVSQIFMYVGVLGVAVIAAGLVLGLIKMSLDLVDKRPTDFSQMFNYFPLTFSALVGYLIFHVAMQVGMFLLIVPGIIVTIKLKFFPYFIVEDGCGPIESLQKSWDLTKGVKWQLFLFDLVLMLMNFVGTLCFGVGVFVTMVISLGAVTFVFRKLQAKSETPLAETPSPIR